jgi:Mat/Ecp fimbriae major subunit
MSKFAKAAIATSIVAALAFGASSAQAATGTATARAKILRQLTVTSDRDLNFGTIVTGTSAGNIVLSSAGAVTTCGVTGSGGVCSGTATSARFNVSGAGAQVVTVSLPTASFNITNTAGDTMAVSTLSGSAATVTLSGTFGAAAAGTGSFTVGGTLGVGANQADGDYAGTFNVTVNYQ